MLVLRLVIQSPGAAKGPGSLTHKGLETKSPVLIYSLCPWACPHQSCWPVLYFSLTYSLYIHTRHSLLTSHSQRQMYQWLPSWTYLDELLLCQRAPGHRSGPHAAGVPCHTGLSWYNWIWCSFPVAAQNWSFHASSQGNLPPFFLFLSSW